MTTTLDKTVANVADLVSELESLAAKLRSDATCQEDRRTAHKAEVVAAHARLLLAELA